jgi:hypothetical protein
MWRLIALRVAFTLDLPGDPAAIADHLSAQIRPWRWWHSLFPSAGEYVSGQVSATRVSLPCVRCHARGGKLSVRRVVAIRALLATHGGTRARVVVRLPWPVLLLNWLLLALAIGSLVACPVLLLEGSVGPVIAAGCGGLVLGAVPLWLFASWHWSREVEQGRGHIAQVLLQCVG